MMKKMTKSSQNGKYFCETTKQLPSGKYEAIIPFKANAELGRSDNSAKHRLKTLWKIFEKRPDLEKAYVEQINDVIQREVLIPAKREEIKYFVNSHLVVKEEPCERWKGPNAKQRRYPIS